MAVDGDRFGHALEAFLGEQLDEMVKVVRLQLVVTLVSFHV